MDSVICFNCIDLNGKQPSEDSLWSRSFQGQQTHLQRVTVDAAALFITNLVGIQKVGRVLSLNAENDELHAHLI